MASTGLQLINTWPSNMHHCIICRKLCLIDYIIYLQRRVIVHVTFLKLGEINTLKEVYEADVLLRTKWRLPELDIYDGNKAVSDFLIVNCFSSHWARALSNPFWTNRNLYWKTIHGIYEGFDGVQTRFIEALPTPMQ